MSSSPATEPIVELRGVGKRYGAVDALVGVDITITAGQVHALVGENGAGKSTLGKIIIGALRPDSGVLSVGGRPTHYHSPHDALADGITGIAQEIALVPARSVMENVFLGREPTRARVVKGRALRQKFVELEQRTKLGLRVAPESMVGSLSIADQQQVEILRALARDARVVVMDEPTAALAKTESQKLFDVVRQLRENGTTVIYISHFLHEVLDLADQITILRDGHVVRSAPAATETVDSIVSSMLGRALTQTFPLKQPPTPGAPVRLSIKTRRNVSIEIRAGEIVGLAGLIGAGRTATARAVFGADSAGPPAVSLDGRALTIRSPRDAIRSGIAYVPESRKDQGLIMGRSAIENITLPFLHQLSWLGVIARGRELRSSRQLLERLNVRIARLEAPVANLSGGNQQKVLFARWLFSTPKVLIADEPTRGVDVGAKISIYELIRDLASEGIGVLLISSEHEELIGLAHRVLVMREHRVVAELEGDRITEDNIVSAALTG